MKIVLIKSHLKDAVERVVGATGNNQNLPILKNIFMQADEKGIVLAATNLEIAIRATVPGKVLEPGTLTVPASTLLQIVSNLTSERINLEVKNNILEVKTDVYQATLQGVPGDEFPIIPTVKEERGTLRIKGVLLREALEQVIIAAQISELRPELGSILFLFTLDSLKLVATDSFRLAEKTIVKTQFQTTYADSFRLLVPLKTTQELLRALNDEEEVLMKDDGNQVTFETPSVLVVSRLIDGNFPDYAAVLPKEFGAQIILDGPEFAGAVKLASVFGTKVSEVKIKVMEGNKSIQITSAEAGVGENASILPAKVEGAKATEREVSFNWRYLMDGIKAVHGKDLFLGINQEEGRAALMRTPNDASYLYIVMPILKA